jgi:hypothetical protein
MVPSAGAVDILWVHEDHGPGFDVGWKDLLAASGHNVQNRIFTALDQAAIDEMNAAPLVIFSRDTNSGEYDDDNEVAQWNGITAPMIVMTPYLLRSSRWRMADSTSIVDVSGNLEAVDPNHPIFDGVALDASNQVAVWDNTAFGPDDNIDLLGTTDFGNATVIAQEAGTGYPWIATWETGVEYYSGSGQFASGPRMFLSGGSDDDPNSWGGENFTAAGEQILLNAIEIMAIPEPSALASLVAGALLLLGFGRARRSRAA